MADFIGTHQGKLDAKNRVSVPASFRTSLKAKSASGNTAATAPSPLILRPSHRYPCLEAWSEQAFDALSEHLAKLAEFSQEHDDLSTALYAEAIRIEADKEGRIVLPAELTTHAGLTDKGVVFMGVGKIFEIWDIAAAERRKADARQHSAALRFSSPGVAA